MTKRPATITDPRSDPVVAALSALVPGEVVRGELERGRGRRLRWVETGTDGPPVILVAGAGEVALDWAAILPALAARFRVIAYDRAGLGGSDPVRPLTLNSQVDDLVALLDLAGPAVLVGHSWGGLLVQLAAIARPDNIMGLVLVDPYHEEVSDAVPFTLRAASRVMFNGVVLLKVVGLFNRIAAKMGRALGERCAQDPRVQSLLAEAYVRSYATIRQVATIRAENRLGDSCAGQIRKARARSVAPNVPVRVLTAGRGKPPTLQQLAQESAEQTAARFPRGLHVVIADSGHYIHKDRPNAVVAAIVDVTGCRSD